MRRLTVRTYNRRATWAIMLLLAAAITAGACSSPAPGTTATPPTAGTPTGASGPGSVALSLDGWVDASATLDPATTPVYDGNTPLTFAFLMDMRKGDPLSLSSLTMGAHSGTHVDAPMHFISDGASVDQVPLTALVGSARVIDIADSVQSIDAAELNRHDWKGAERVLFRTRSSVRGWMAAPVFHHDFAYVAPDAAQLLADAGVKLVGIDYISIEKFGAPVPKTHQILLGKGIPVIEGLSLGQMQAGDYDLIVLPIKVAGHEGAPARAIMRKHTP